MCSLSAAACASPCSQPFRRKATRSRRWLKARRAFRPGMNWKPIGQHTSQCSKTVRTRLAGRASILHGAEMLPWGNKRSRLHNAVERLFADEFPERILPFDAEAALLYPKIVARRARLGRP